MLLNLVPRSHALVRTEINFCLAHSIDLPSKKVSVKWDPRSREIEKFGKGTQGKRKRQVRKSDRGTVKSSHLRHKDLEARGQDLCAIYNLSLHLLQTAHF